jgi:hypothetical protein
MYINIFQAFWWTCTCCGCLGWTGQARCKSLPNCIHKLWCEILLVLIFTYLFMKSVLACQQAKTPSLQYQWKRNTNKERKKTQKQDGEPPTPPTWLLLLRAMMRRTERKWCVHAWRASNRKRPLRPPHQHTPRLPGVWTFVHNMSAVEEFTPTPVIKIKV